MGVLTISGDGTEGAGFTLVLAEGGTLACTDESPATAGTVTNVTASLPLTSTGGATPNIAINPATPAAAGSMSAADKLKLNGLGSSVASGAALTALPTAGMVQGQWAYVQSFGAWWTYQPASVLAPDGSTVLAAAGGGNWLRTVSGIQEQATVQAVWNVDPIAGSDENSGATALLPVQHFAEITRRMGTSSPTLKQSTTILFLTSQPDTSDPVIFNPIIEAGAQVTIQGTLQPIAAGVILAGTVAKNRVTGQLLNTNLGASALQGMLVVNTTHPSRAWAWKSLGANVWAMTQPLTALAPNTFPNPVEVDTWADGDSVNLFAPTVVAIVSFQPILQGINNVTFENYPALYNVRNPNIGTGIGQSFVALRTAVSFIESWSDGKLTFDVANVNATTVNLNSVAAAGVSGGFISNRSVNHNASPGWFGGAIGLSGNSNVLMVAIGLRLDYDAILAGNSSGAGAGVTYASTFEGGLFYLDTTTTLNIEVQADLTHAQSGGFICWGPGTLNATGSARISYPPGAGGAVATFQNTGGVTLNGQTTAYAVGPGAAAVWNGGIALNPTNLDAAFGVAGFGGRAINPGGASVSNVGV